jgi:UDP-glucuronate decarboxylase
MLFMWLRAALLPNRGREIDASLGRTGLLRPLAPPAAKRALGCPAVRLFLALPWPVSRAARFFSEPRPSPPTHLLSPASLLSARSSVLGAMNMLGLAKRVKARILQASTSEVYGDPLTSPQVEEDWGNVNCNGVRSCYDEGKRAAETLCFDYNRQNGVDIRVARIFNTYGPGMHPFDGRVTSNFLVQAINGEDITVYGKGDQTRSFCYVDDLIDGLIRLMNQDKTIGPVNIGNPGEFTIKQLAELAIKTTGSKSKIIYQPLPGDDPKQRKPDITKARTRAPRPCTAPSPPAARHPALSRPRSSAAHVLSLRARRPAQCLDGSRRSSWRRVSSRRPSTSRRSTSHASRSPRRTRRTRTPTPISRRPRSRSSELASTRRASAARRWNRCSAQWTCCAVPLDIAFALSSLQERDFLRSNLKRPEARTKKLKKI